MTSSAEHSENSPHHEALSAGSRSHPARLVVSRSVAAAMVVSIAAIMPTFLAGALAVQIQSDLGFGPSELGLAVSIYFVTCTIAAAILGKHIDRIGWQRGVRIAAVGSTVTLLCIAALARTWWVLVLFMVLGGLVNAVSTPAANLTLARVVPVGRQALMFGVKQSAMPAAIMLAGLAVPAIGLTIGWRWAFVSTVAFPLLAVVILPRLRPVERTAKSPSKATTDSPDRRSAWRMAVVGVLGAAAQVALASFLVVSSVEIGMDEGLAGILLAVGSLISIVIRVVGGWIADTRRTDGLLAISLMLILGAISLALLALGVSGATRIVAALLAFAGSWGWTGLYHFAVIQRNMHAPAAATGYLQAGLAGGAAIGPLIYGLLADHVSYGAAWALMSVLSLAAAAILQAERRAHRRIPTQS